jgi:cytochrome c oxidase cbb3-type subunit 3
MNCRTPVLLLACLSLLPSLAAGQAHHPPSAAQTGKPDAVAAQRGKAQFQSSCGFCHGNDATGSRAPDLLHSAILSHDENGNLVGSVIRNGRADKGMPAFSNLKEDQVADIVTFLHFQAYQALHSASVPGDYPLAKMLTGNAAAGKAYFEGAGGCTGCHSVTKDLAGIAKKYAPVDLQQHMVYPSNKNVERTAVVTLPSGQRFEGKLAELDEFNIGIIDKEGWHQSWPINAVKVEIKDPLAVHRDLMSKYTDADVHNLFAYLETLK